MNIQKNSPERGLASFGTVFDLVKAFVRQQLLLSDIPH